jgi:hypothetical protein
LRTDHGTLMRLFAGRPAARGEYRLDGASAQELSVF